MIRDANTIEISQSKKPAIFQHAWLRMGVSTVLAITSVIFLISSKFALKPSFQGQTSAVILEILRVLALLIAGVGLLSLLFHLFSAQTDVVVRHPKAAIKLWFSWLAATTLGLAGGTAIVYITLTYFGDSVWATYLVLAGILIGVFGIGLLQQRIIQQYVYQTRTWVWATLISWWVGLVIFVVAAVVGFVAGIYVGYIPSDFSYGGLGPYFDSGVSIIGAISGAINGALVGLWQMDILQHGMSKPKLWPFTSAVGWALGSAYLASVVLTAKMNPYLGVILTAAIIGIINGSTLVWLLWKRGQA